MTCIPGLTQEIPGSNPSCETLTVRRCLTVAGGEIVPLPGGAPAVVFDDAVSGDNLNIRSDRAADQSPIDNTQTQVTNLGSADGLNDPTATGATGFGSTIGGGDDNTASGDYSTVIGGAGNIATGYGAVAMGDFAEADGYAAVAEGNGFASGNVAHAEGSSTASGNFAHAEGERCQATAEAAHAEGRVNVASGLGAHAEGYKSNGDPSASPNCTASGIGAHCEGSNGVASGNAAHCEGEGNIASGRSAHAEGGAFALGGGAGNTASGVSSHARGNFCVASGDVSTAAGVEATASRETQDAYGSGGGVLGAQTSKLVMRGTTPGALAAEVVELLFGYGGLQTLQLEDNKAYLVRVSGAVGGVQGVTRVTRGFVLEFVARRAAGVTVIAGALSGTAAGDATTSDWTLVASVGVGPDRIKLTFTSGAVVSRCAAVAKVEFTEIAFV